MQTFTFHYSKVTSLQLQRKLGYVFGSHASLLQLQVAGNKFCMYKSFKCVLFNKSSPNLAKSQIRPNFGRSRISAGFVKKAGFWPELNSGTALLITDSPVPGKYRAQRRCIT